MFPISNGLIRFDRGDHRDTNEISLRKTTCQRSDAGTTTCGSITCLFGTIADGRTSPKTYKLLTWDDRRIVISLVLTFYRERVNR